MNKIYSRLAFTNIKNNKTLYMPYIISGMVMIAMFYVMMFLNNSKGLGKVPGADVLVDIMGLGSWILGNVTRIPRHELPQTLDFSDFLPLFT